MQENYSMEELLWLESEAAASLSPEMQNFILSAARYVECTPNEDQLLEALKLGVGKMLFPTKEEEHAWIKVRTAGDSAECFSNVHEFLDEIKKAQKRSMKKMMMKAEEAQCPFEAVFGLKVYFAYDGRNKLSGIKGVAHVVAYHDENKAYYDPSPECGEKEILFVPHNEMFTEEEKTRMSEAYEEGKRFEMGFLLIDLSEKEEYGKHVEMTESITNSDVLGIRRVTDKMPVRFD